MEKTEQEVGEDGGGRRGLVCIQYVSGLFCSVAPGGDSLTNTGDGACFVCQVINIFSPEEVGWEAAPLQHSLLSLPLSRRTPAPPSARRSTPLAVRRGAPSLPLSDTNKLHAPTPDLVVRLPLRSTQHHLWMFYTH